MKTKHWLLCAIAFIHAVVLCSCGIENYRKADFAKMENKDFPIAIVTVTPTDAYHLASAENVEPIVKMIPYDDIALMIKKRCGLDVDTTGIKEKISAVKDWTTMRGMMNNPGEITVSTGRIKNYVSVTVDARPYIWYERKAKTKPLYCFANEVIIRINSDDMTTCKVLQFRTDFNGISPYNSKDFFNVINNEYIPEDDEARSVEVRDKFFGKLDKDLQNRFVAWLYKQRTEAGE